MDDVWFVNTKLITRHGVVDGSVRITGGKIAEVRHGRASHGRAIKLRGAYLAPGFIDVHVWGPPDVLSHDCARHGTTAFLSAIGPEPLPKTINRLVGLNAQRGWPGAICLGAHLEGPFLNPKRAGALPKQWMRRPTVTQLRLLSRAAGARLITIAPELPGAVEAIRWCRRRGIVASLGHSDADAGCAERAVDAGASAVTHVFNGMRPFHHRAPGLLDVALTDERLTAMVILDGIHISPSAFRVLVRAKGPNRVCLVTDSIRYQGWDVVRHGARPPGPTLDRAGAGGRRDGGAYYLKTGTLAGSGLTMMAAVRNAIRFGEMALSDAIRMASEVPARLLGERSRGVIAVGRRADLVAFDTQFRVRLTVVGGRIVYEG